MRPEHILGDARCDSREPDLDQGEGQPQQLKREREELYDEIECVPVHAR